MKTIEQTKQRLYELMDSFLVEGDKPRPTERLNQDRHLFVENCMQLFKDESKAQLMELVGEPEPVDEFSSDPEKSIHPRLRNKFRDQLLAKISGK